MKLAIEQMVDGGNEMKTKQPKVDGGPEIELQISQSVRHEMEMQIAQVKNDELETQTTQVNQDLGGS